MAYNGVKYVQVNGQENGHVMVFLLVPIFYHYGKISIATFSIVAVLIFRKVIGLIEFKGIF